MSNRPTPALSSSSSPQPAPPSRSCRGTKRCARQIERCCCVLGTYFPLAFVYSLSTWAVLVQASLGYGNNDEDSHVSSVRAVSALGVALYTLLNASYSVAVFTDPGSPSQAGKTSKKHQYSSLPTTEPPAYTTVTVSSRGRARYCKKCLCPKPDRAHHCSSCGRCVLKMDHHCPWLATCLGLHNYKAFALFLIYVSLFAWVCLVNTGFWIWTKMLTSSDPAEIASVNIIVLAVVSGVIGLVLTGFTIWHLILVFRGQTTIECLEKTRYLSGVRNRVERNRLEQARADHHPRLSSEYLTDRVKRAGDQILEFHANAVPGASRFEEGEEHRSPTPSSSPPARQDYLYSDFAWSDTDTPAQQALRRAHMQAGGGARPKPGSSYGFERDREADRYAEYLDDRDSEKLPNAFDLGWKRNWIAVFGPNPLLWALPVMNSPGDGWRWETSEKWAKAKQELEQRQWAEAQNVYGDHGSGGGQQPYGSAPGGYDYGARGADDHVGYSAADPSPPHLGHSAVSMDTLNSRGRGRERQAEPERGRAWGGRFRKDIDRSGDDSEPGQFEVSSDEEDDRIRDHFHAQAWGET